MQESADIQARTPVFAGHHCPSWSLAVQGKATSFTYASSSWVSDPWNPKDSSLPALTIQSQYEEYISSYKKGAA